MASGNETLREVKAKGQQIDLANAIKREVKISRYLKDRGYEIRKDRAQAKWRNGDGWSVAIYDDEGRFQDFGCGGGEGGGSVIDLSMRIEGGNPKEAIKRLANRYGIHIAHSGKREIARYDYTDEHGNKLFRVIRYELPEINPETGKYKKSFVQLHWDKDGKEVWNTDGVRLVPYNLPDISDEVAQPSSKQETIFIVEGEKDADNLAEIGLLATCNPRGAGKWLDDYSAHFKGAANVLIIADRDGETAKFAGQRHALHVRDSLRRIANVEAHIAYVGNEQCKDASDWIAAGATAEDFENLAKDPPTWNWTPSQSSSPANVELRRGEPFCNYTELEVEVADGRTSKPKKKTVREPKLIEAIIKDLDQRFEDGSGAWPRLLGDELFYVGKDDNGKPVIKGLHNDPNQLSAWIGLSGHCCVEFASGVGMTSMKELAAGLQQKRHRYAAASRSPHYPKRDDVYYMCEPPPPPSQDYHAFNTLIDRFCPADETNKTILKMFFAAPMWYVKRCSRPWLVVDTIDAQQSGKTTIIDMIELLYDETAFDFDPDRKVQEIEVLKKQLLGADGLSRRLAKLDNVERAISGSAFAKLVTAKVISGLPPYGKGTVDRPNDLTFYVTMNGAKTDRDMARRCYQLLIRAPETNVDRDAWTIKTKSFIETNRRQIQGDIIGLLQNAKPRSRKNGGSGFPEFDRAVLSAVCETDAEFEAADAALAIAAANGDADRERAEEFLSRFHDALDSSPDYRKDLPVIITRTAIEFLLDPRDGTRPRTQHRDVVLFAKSGSLDGFSKEEAPRNDPDHRSRGSLYFGEIGPDGMTDCQFLDYSNAANALTLARSNHQIHYPSR